MLKSPTINKVCCFVFFLFWGKGVGEGEKEREREGKKVVTYFLYKSVIISSSSACIGLLAAISDPSYFGCI